MIPKPKLKVKPAATSGPRKITASPDFAARRKRVFKGTLSAATTKRLNRAIAGELGDEKTAGRPTMGTRIAAANRAKMNGLGTGT